jgi:BirA family transcriptional regulator, biotin operon repressor / biotin---[acetyl-CoA-carboxylase] ligase
MNDLILKALQKEKPVSGEKLAKMLNISRTAVWKHINQLRSSGYQIDSSSRRGYCLIKNTDLLLPDEIKLNLNTKVMGKQIIYHAETSSTQDIAAELARRGAAEGTVVIAEMQRCGRGRKGRKWVSVSKGGVYLSLILRPDIEPSRILQLPLITGVALVKSIENLISIKSRIKWPNDIFVGNKKIGGILAEMSCEIDKVNFIVLGIGINVNIPGNILDSETSGIAASISAVCGKNISRSNLVQSFLNEFELIYMRYLKSGFNFVRDEWKQLNNTIGSRVKVRVGGRDIEGDALDIDGEGFLLVKKPGGEVNRIVSGDVSLINFAG